MTRHVLLAGIVGSTAYGLAHAGSDVDRLGVFAVDTVELHGLGTPRESVVTARPDVTLHEAAKWCRLALGANPTVTELVWLPPELYETRTDLGDALVAIRGAFLSAERVRTAYLGYARRQLLAVERRLAGDGPADGARRARIAKGAGHLARLLVQGRQLYRTGTVEIRLGDPESVRRFGERVADGDLPAARRLLADTTAELDRHASPLPDRPDERAVEAWLRAVRAAHLAAA
ncbi:MAG TPA: nucleotidyltransferase domain-containing protein [Actinocatenispora sp.]